MMLAEVGPFNTFPTTYLRSNNAAPVAQLTCFALGLLGLFHAFLFRGRLRWSADALWMEKAGPKRPAGRRAPFFLVGQKLLQGQYHLDRLGSVD
jgi:hypothetical protein